ncbi:DUF4102 domain-containing protein [Pantoea sp. S62]|nr:DUF4102 domain-containing protein [Pantoea sp. S62]
MLRYLTNAGERRKPDLVGRYGELTDDSGTPPSFCQDGTI